MLARQRTIEQIGPSAPSPPIRQGARAGPGRSSRAGTTPPRQPPTTTETRAIVVHHPLWRTFPLDANAAGIRMGDVLSKIDPDLRLTLGSLEDGDELTVLLVPCDAGPVLRMLLAARRHEGRIEYRVLRLVNAIEVTGEKAAILELATCPQITRMRSAGGFLHGD
jgi:hypothetical protein